MRSRSGHLPACLAAMLLLTAAGCVQCRLPAGDGPRVQHVVVCWLKEPGNAAQRQALIDTRRALGAIPGLLAISAGTAVPSERPAVDDSFDVSLVMTFANAAAMQAYVAHPEHQRIVREVVAPLAARIVIYDVVEAAGP